MSATDLDPRVAEQMRLIKERKEREAAEAAAAKAAQEAAFARQVEEGKIVWEAELRIEMEAITFTPEDLDFLCTVAARGYTASIADPRFACKRQVPDWRSGFSTLCERAGGTTYSSTANGIAPYICPHGPGGRWHKPENIRVYTSAGKGRLEQARDAFRATWLRKEVGQIVADAHRAKQIAEAEAARVHALEAAVARAALKEKIVAVAQSSPGVMCNLTPDLVQFGIPVSHVCYKKPVLRLDTFIYDYTGAARSHGPTPNAAIQTPASWNTHYEAGRIPFLPQCPVCSKQVSITTEYSRVTRVACPDHYDWDPATDTHYKYTPCPPPEPHNAATFGSGLRPTALPHKWDPKDPDGSIAAAARKEVEAADIRAQIAALQARLAALA
jgi:hypothetical protein